MTAAIVIGAIILTLCTIATLIILKRGMKTEADNHIREMEIKFNKKGKK